MKKKAFWILFILSAFATSIVDAQEINARVVVDYSQVNQGAAEKQLFTNLQNQMVEFINTRKWSTDVFTPIERIQMSITLIIEGRSSPTQFNGKMLIQTTRPVFNSAYNTVLMNYNDQDLQFEYTEFQPFDYNDGAFINNLTSIMAFYVYMAMGFDYDSFALDGGATYFTKALNVLNNAQSSGSPGWRSNERLTNRYWYVTALTNKTYAPVFKGIYTYHRLGLDKMQEDPNEGRKTILSALEDMRKGFKSKPGSVFQQTFMNSKSEELINIFKSGTNTEKQQFLQIVNDIDPTNGLKYQRINQ